MSNIFNIQQELLTIFDELEENGGELTPELEEQLNITQEEFRDKIKSYSNVVKMLENDIIDIKAEKARLNDLQKSKENTIERLKKIMIDAIELFGDTTKAGGKYIDYGTGKVSMRVTQAVEVEEDILDRFVNRLISGCKWYNECNNLQSNIIKSEDILDFINSKSHTEEIEGEEITEFTTKDIEHLNANVNLDIDIKTLISTKIGVDLLKALLDYNVFKVSCKPDKKAIKDDAKKEQFMPIYASIVNNKSITIK